MDILKKIYQDFKTYYKNGHELLKKIRDIYYGAPQDVTLQWEDPDTGNIENLSIPSYSKLRDRFMSGVNSAMYKIIYVNQQDGSDSHGDGTQNAPFKTLQKAIDSIPSGGYAIIYFTGNYTMVEDHVTINNKYIWFNFTGGKLYLKPIIRNCCGRKYKGVTRFLINRGHISFSFKSGANGGIEISEDYPDGWNNAESHDNGVAVFGLYYGSIDIDLYNSKPDNNIVIKIPQDFYLFSANGPSDWGYTSHTGVLSFGLSIDNASGQKFILDGKLGILNTANGTVANLSLFFDQNVQIVDSQNNTVDIKSKIVGIIRDSNGVPRNVVSSIVL